MNDTHDTGNDLISATYATAAVYFAIVGVMAVFINLSIIIVYFKNKKVSLMSQFIVDVTIGSVMNHALATVIDRLYQDFDSSISSR